MWEIKESQQRKVGREETACSSNRPELAAFVLALRGAPVIQSMPYLSDNKALVKDVKICVGEGGKVTLVGALHVDILQAALEELQKRTTARRAPKMNNSRSSDVCG